MSHIVMWGLTILPAVNIAVIVLVFMRLIAIQKNNAAKSKKEDFHFLRWVQSEYSYSIARRNRKPITRS